MEKIGGIMKKNVLREYLKNRETITVEQVQAVANAIVEEAKETDKTVEQVVTEIVEESKPKRTRKPKGEK